MKYLVQTLLLIAVLLSSTIRARPQFRGPDRDGHYPDKNLLNVWPENGLKPILEILDIGNGYASPAITDDAIFIAGEKDSIGTLYAFSHEGEKIWSYTYGEEFMYKYLGSRSTPTLDEDKIYYFGSMGDAFCLSAENGVKIWHVHLGSEYGQENLRWGNTESPLIYEEKIIFTPGDSIHNMIALNKNTGEHIWSSKGAGDLSSYCSPILIDQGGKKVIVTQTQYHIIGVDVENGNLLWKVENNSPRGTNPNTPIVSADKLFNSIGYGLGSALYQLKEDLSDPDTIWTTADMDNKMDGPLLIDGAIYGCGDRKKYWFCLDWETGKTLWMEKGPAISSCIYADGKIIAHGHDGSLSLIRPNKEKLEVLSTFSTTTGEKTLFAHPTLHNGLLYIRDNDKLTVYDVRK